MSELDEAMAAMDRAFDVLERGDIDEFAAMLAQTATPDFEFTSAISSALSGGAIRGREQVVDWFREFLDTLAQHRWVERRYEPVGLRAILVLARFEAQGPASDVPVVTEVGQIYELEGGLFKRGVSYRSHADAREAAVALVA